MNSYCYSLNCISFIFAVLSIPSISSIPSIRILISAASLALSAPEVSKMVYNDYITSVSWSYPSTAEKSIILIYLSAFVDLKVASIFVGDICVCIEILALISSSNYFF